MNWRLRFRLKHYLANSIWIYPSICMLMAMVLVRVSHRIDDHMGWLSTMQPDTARTVLSTLAASMFTFPAHWDPKLRIPRGQVVAAASIVSPKY